MLTDLPGNIWIDGEWVAWPDARIPISTHSLHYGMGVFEGVRAYPTATSPAIFRLQAHTDRLFRSAKILGLEISLSKDVINQAQVDVIKKNNLQHAYIRPLVFLGGEQLGLHTKNLSTHVAVLAWEWGAYLGEEAVTKGLKICSSSFRRHSASAMMAKAKACGNYLNSALAVQEASRNGYQEALMYDQDGHVAEGSGENIFLVRNGKLITPDTSSIIEGITRDTVMQFAKDMQIPVEERRITRDEVYTADEAFFTGTAVEIVPIRECDGRVIGAGERGPVTTALQEKYFKMVSGELDPGHEWLTYCN